MSEERIYVNKEEFDKIQSSSIIDVLGNQIKIVSGIILQLQDIKLSDGQKEELQKYGVSFINSA